MNNKTRKSFIHMHVFSGGVQIKIENIKLKRDKLHLKITTRKQNRKLKAKF